MEKITERDSHYEDIDKMSVGTILHSINQEDRSVPLAVANKLEQIEVVVKKIVEQCQNGGRLFYIGSGTSGRLGILDASECPPTFGVSPELVIGLIAGGDRAIRKAVESAEDDYEQGWKDLQEYQISRDDFLIGIAASGTTPYVVGAVKRATEEGVPNACITCNLGMPLEEASQHPIIVPVGPEFITGSTRMKAGTAQKLILNMISTAVMVKLGRVKGNKMVDMQMNNQKLRERAVRILMDDLKISKHSAQELLEKHGSVRRALEAGNEK